MIDQDGSVTRVYYVWVEGFEQPIRSPITIDRLIIGQVSETAIRQYAEDCALGWLQEQGHNAHGRRILRIERQW